MLQHHGALMIIINEQNYLTCAYYGKFLPYTDSLLLSGPEKHQNRLSAVEYAPYQHFASICFFSPKIVVC